MDTILVIDDERNIRTLVSRVLAQDDVEVHTAGTGKEGLELAEELSPDVALINLRLPNMDNIQIVRELRSEERRVGKECRSGWLWQAIEDKHTLVGARRY